MAKENVRLTVVALRPVDEKQESPVCADAVTALWHGVGKGGVAYDYWVTYATHPPLGATVMVPAEGRVQRFLRKWDRRRPVWADSFDTH